jgi:Recombinase zinc beta ribbon domain
VPRDRAEWIGIKIPAIIPQSLFNQVQKRLEWNRMRYRNPRQVQLLSSLVRCGSCGGGFYAYRNWYKDKQGPEARIFYKVAYKCNWRLRQQMHSKNSAVERCHNKEIKAEALEGRVFAMIQDIMLDPTKLRECMDLFKDDSQVMGRRLERRLKAIELRLRALDDEKRRILDIYASGDLSREAYVAKSRHYDTEMTKLTGEQNDLVQRMPLLHNTEAVEVAMTEYCGRAKARFERCDDFATKRQFLLDHIEKVVFWNDNVTVHGSVPILQKCGGGAAEPEDAAQIGFCIESRISRDEKLAGRRRECENEARNGAVCVRRKSFVKVSF